jgi:hypothetical protein
MQSPRENYLKTKTKIAHKCEFYKVSNKHKETSISSPRITSEECVNFYIARIFIETLRSWYAKSKR